MTSFLRTHDDRRHRRTGARRRAWSRPPSTPSALRVIAAALILSASIVGLRGVSPRVALAADVPVTVTITKISCLEDCDATGLEAAGAAEPDFYARIFINGQATNTNRAPDDQSSVTPLDMVISRTVPNDVAPSPLIPVTIQIWDHDSTSGDDLGDVSPVANNNNLNLVVDLRDGTWSGDATTSCASGDGEDSDDEEYYPLEVCFDISTLSASGDADGDGLLDGWERSGFDADGNGTVDVPLHLSNFAADPFRKDIFLELDFEAARPPTRAGIEAMRNAFAVAPIPNPDGSNGVTLHVDVGRTIDPTADERGIPNTCTNGVDDNADGPADGVDPLCVYLDASSELAGTCGNGVDDDGVTGTDGADPDCRVGDDLGRGGALLDGAGNPVTVGACNLDATFYATKKARFDANRAWVFRYAVQSLQPPASPTCQQSGGQGEIGGNDFISHNIDAGTLMHELGHNLDLHHGGSIDDNCKPNYLSVMNYNLQFGIPRLPGGSILDYSPPRIAMDGSTRAVAPLTTLVENALNENVILDPSDPQNQTIFFDSTGTLITANVNLNPNWNGDADPPRETNVVANIDTGVPATSTTPSVGAPVCANTATNSTLVGDNDWNRVSVPFRQFGDSADSAIDPSSPDSPTDEELEEIQRAIHRTDLVAAIASSPDPVAAGTDLTLTASITNAGPNPSLASILTVAIPVETGLSGAVPAPCVGQTPTVVRCDFGRLLAGENRTITLVAAVPADLVYVNGAPLTVTASAMVDDLAGDDADPTSDTATVGTQAVAVADLAVTAFEVPNPPVELRIGEELVVALRSVITSDGPSSPMDTTLTLTAQADAGARVSPTWVRTSQPALLAGASRVVEDHLIIECRTPGRHRFDAAHRIDPTLPADSDPAPANNELRTAFEVDCVGQEPVVINVVPGRWPNEAPLTGEFFVAIMTTGAGEYGRVAPFDAAWIIPESVRVGSRRMLDGLESGGTPTSADLRDAEEPIPPETTVDGDVDLVVLVQTDGTGLRASDTEACVQGLYVDPDTGEELPFSGCDAIVLMS